jgi:uncharacterized protein (TIGR00730 family)
MKICVYGASSNKIADSYIEQAEELGEKMAIRGHSLIFGAGSGGMMGAVARGVDKYNGEIVGIAPSFFNVDGVLFDKCDELIQPKTMRQRKQILEDMSDAFIITPGGVGTFDEFFEILTLKQLARHPKAIVVFNINGFYDKIISLLDDMAEEGFLSRETIALFDVFTDIDEMLTYIENYSGKLVDVNEVKFKNLNRNK